MKKILIGFLLLGLYSISFAGFGGDSLGSHNANKRLDMQENDINNVGSIDADTVTAENITVSSGIPGQFTAYVNEVGGITKGQAVYVSGKTGTRQNVSLCDNLIAGKDWCDGIALANYANAAEGIFLRSGYIENHNTNDWTEQNHLWIGQNGDLVDVRPTSGTVQMVGVVTNKHASVGSMFIHIGQVMDFFVGRNGQVTVIRMPINDVIEFRDDQNNTIAVMTASSITFITDYIMKISEIHTSLIQGTTDFDTRIIFWTDWLQMRAGGLYIIDGKEGTTDIIKIGASDWDFGYTGYDDAIDTRTWSDGNKVFAGSVTAKNIKAVYGLIGTTLSVAGRGDFGGDVHADALYDSGGQVTRGFTTFYYQLSGGGDVWVATHTFIPVSGCFLKTPTTWTITGVKFFAVYHSTQGVTDYNIAYSTDTGDTCTTVWSYIFDTDVEVSTSTKQSAWTVPDTTSIDAYQYLALHIRRIPLSGDLPSEFGCLIRYWRENEFE